MENRFRLRANSMFLRKEEEHPEEPLRIIFLSVEGNVTEQQYFKYIQKYRAELKINARVHVHTLKKAKNDNLSAPEDVLALLEEYIELREADFFPERLRNAIPEKYSGEFIEKYLNTPGLLAKEEKKNFELLLQQVGIDLLYERFLQEYKGFNDVFGIVIDRDFHSHSVKQLKSVYHQCLNKGYKFFITTPCIEFWLLLHLADFEETYQYDAEKFKENIRISDKHSFTSREVSNLAGHAKCINENKFKELYLPKVDFAIEQIEKYFTMDVDKLIGTDDNSDTKKGELGSNLPKLFELLREL